MKVVLFDFDNTLVDYIRDDVQSLIKVTSLLPGEIRPELFVKTAISKIMDVHELINIGQVSSQALHLERLRRTVESFGLQWNPAYLETYLTSFLWNVSVYAGVQDILKSIRRYKMTGLVTNSYNYEEQKQRIRSSGLEAYFDQVLVCSEIGFYKPDSRAFLYIPEKLGIKPEDCLFVGDSERHDILGARKAGMKTVKLIHRNCFAKGTQADYQCRGIRELKYVLSNLCW